MLFHQRLAALVATTALALPVLAAAPYDGRWAASPVICSDEASPTSPVTVTSQMLSWTGVQCVVGASYLVKDAWHVNARCWGEGMVSDVPIKLQVLRGDRLAFSWAKARPEELRRCP
jgi:hypothetical protein